MMFHMLSMFVAPFVVGVSLLLIERYLNTHNKKK